MADGMKTPVATDKKSNKTVFLLIDVALIVISVALAFSIFWPVLRRFFQSLFGDLLQSIVFYVKTYISFFTGDFSGIDAPSVSTLPEGIEELLPFQWSDFVAKMGRFWTAYFDAGNFGAWFSSLMEGLSIVLMVALPVVALLILIWKLVLSAYKEPNVEYGKKSVALTKYLLFESKVYVRVRDKIKAYVGHVAETGWVKLVLIFLWAINLNLFTILFEAIAFLLYFSMSFDFASVWTQIVRLVYDVSVPLQILPWWLDVIIVCKILDVSRRKLGVAILRAQEEHNVDFLRKYPGALFLVGKQRAKKTTIITDMALSQEVVFREDALKLLKERDKQFPYFPWGEVELFYWRSRESLPTLASLREFLAKLQYHFERRDRYEKYPNIKNMVHSSLKRKGYESEDFIFGYDFERYGLEYNDKAAIINVFEAIEGYLQLFYVYAAPTSLIFGNYSIRTDLQWQDLGNFPILDGDFFDRPAENQKETSQYCHVAKMDCFRLGMVSNPEDPYIDGFEVGILNMMEVGKERGNQITNQGVKSTDAGVNAKNDGFEMDIKMRAHGSTIDNYTFFRFFLDEQRPDSLSADNKDLCTIVMIKKMSDAKVVLPFSKIDETIYLFFTKIYEKVYYTLRNLRGDETLLVYLLKKLYSPIFRHWDRIKKQFSVNVATLKTSDSMQDEVLTDKDKYYVSHYKAYKDRFATDGIKQFYHKKAKGSRYGLNDFPTYSGKHITIEEMEASGSIFYEKLINAFLSKEMRKQRLAEMRAKKKK